MSAAEPADLRAATPISDDEYDGIQELDNPQPTWFRLIFLATIVFAAGYWVWYHMGGPGEPHLAVYQREYAEHRARRAALEMAEGAAVSEESLSLLVNDSGAMTRGKAVFLQSCASCHGAAGGGGVGPNLTDDFQLHGATRADLYATVRNGVPEKGMISWLPVLAPADLTAVAAFVSTLRHTNVAGGKPPQGPQVAPFAKAAP
jgi:cytochrome c oxidase cbb3-type subunit III